MVGRTLVAHQPTYLPYLGLLHKVAHADVFIVQDDLRYVKDAVSNRNRISDDEGWKWLTIPVHKHDGSTYATVTPASEDWAKSHRRVLEAAYRRAPFASRLEELYDLNDANRGAPLSVLNLATIRWMARLFEIDVDLRVESDLALPDFDNPNDRLISLSQQHGCVSYLSGVGAHAYIEEDRWEAAGVALEWSDFEPLPYDRGPLPWVPNLSAVDAIAYVEDLPALLR
jgi:WbqC-like protein family